MRVQEKLFDRIEGKDIISFTIKTKSNMIFRCINYGCIITDIIMPDRTEKAENVVLGFDNMADYIDHSPFFGAVIGRVAGRISNAQFNLNGREYKLAKNEGSHHLHGGKTGFGDVIWDYKVIEEEDKAGVEFSYISIDGEEGYPGTVHVRTTYLLNEKDELEITYQATTDEDTIINLTNHSYFNLSGDLNKKISEHDLKLKSSQFLELDKEMIPTGERVSVNQTPFDFREGARINQGIDSGYPQNELAGNGYDHPFILDDHFDKEMILYDSESGRQLIVETDQPCVVIFTSNQYEGEYLIRGVKPHHHMAICLETQGFPDAINQEKFPSILLKKDEEYKAVTKYSFSIQ